MTSMTNRRMPTTSRSTAAKRPEDRREIVMRPGPAERNPRRAERKDKITIRVLGIAIPVTLLLMWQFAATEEIIDPRFFPAPTTIWDNWGNLMEGGLYWEHLWASVRRIAEGYAAGAIVGLVVGLVIGGLRILREALEPLIIGLYSVPKLAILPLLLLIFGIGETPKVLMIAIAVFFIVLINTIGALETVAPGHTEAAKSFGLSRLQTIRHVILPSALPQVFTGMRIAAGIAVLVVVGAEFVAAKRGLGFLIWNSWNLGIPSYMYIGIASIASVGVILNFLLRGLQRLLVPWQDR